MTVPDMKNSFSADGADSNWNTGDEAIRHALNDRWEWLDHQATGNPATKRAAWHDLGDVGAAEDRVRQSHTGRYATELLQNAHDACADAKTTGCAWFEVTESALLIANQGMPFTAERIVSLTRLGSSEKARRHIRHHLIGYKGIGFTAVFEITDRPQVLSTGVSFSFDRQEARRRVVHKIGRSEGDEPVPARYFPLPLERRDWSSDAKSIGRLLANGATTVIRLPFRSNWTPDRVMDDLRAAITPEVLLFTPALSGIEIRSAGAKIGWNRLIGRDVGKGTLVNLVAKDGERRSWLVRSAHIPVSRSDVEALRDDVWKHVRRLNVAVALPWSSGLVSEPVAQRVFAYFPTADRLGRGALIHGDFYLDEARQRIAGLGPQGRISGLVAERAAQLAAELAESLANQGNRLLACLAPIEAADGYGQHLAEQLEAALKSARIVRPALGSRPRRPGELRRVSSEFSFPMQRQLFAMLNARSDLVRPGDDRGRAGELLEQLGCEFVEPADLAQRIEPARARVEYAAALRVLETWLTSLGHRAFLAIARLIKQPVVQDKTGRWRTAGHVVRRHADTPPLPAFLERPELLMPASPLARAFIERLAVEILSPQVALERLLDLSGSEKGRTDSECVEALSFAWRLWQVDRSIFRSRHDLGAFLVPTKRSARTARAWCRADGVYFSSAWTGNRVLETMYGSFGKSEFLAEDPPRGATAKRERMEFFRTFQVADHPRTIPIGGALSQYWGWAELADVAAAHDCPDGHPSTSRSIVGWVIDRLDELLARVQEQPTFAPSFARGLLLLKEPYGPEVRIRCTHSAHRASGSGNKAIGYQRWRLEQIAWVSVTRHPAGIPLAKVSEAWTGMPRSGDRLLVPRPNLSYAEAKRLNVVDADFPSRGAVEQALSILHYAHPNLETAPAEVAETAEWLMRRLDRATQRKPEVGEAPPLPAVTAHGRLWTRRPAIADLPGMPLFSDVALLPEGHWLGLRRAYSLPLASHLVGHQVKLGTRLRIPPLLTEPQRAELLALLSRLSAPTTVTARRLAILRERSAHWINVLWRPTSGGAPIIEKCAFHLALQRDRTDRVLKATLYRAGDLEVDNVALGRVIAGYLDVPDHEHTIALYLSSRRQLVQQQAVTELELSEAKELLRRRRPAREEDPPEAEESPANELIASSSTEEAPPESPAGDQAPQAERGPTASEPLMSRTGHDGMAELTAPDATTEQVLRAGTSTEVSRKYLDPDRTRFGLPRTPQSTVRRGKPSSRNALAKPVNRGEITTAATENDGLIPNVAVEEVAMRVVERYGYTVAMAAEVRDVHLLNRGWDLEFHFADGSWKPVEVKGSSGVATFVITRNEWRAAREHSDYLLFHVTNVGYPDRAAMRVYRRLGERLTEDHMVSLSWVIEGWEALAPEEIPIESIG